MNHLKIKKSITTTMLILLAFIGVLLLIFSLDALIRIDINFQPSELLKTFLYYGMLPILYVFFGYKVYIQKTSVIYFKNFKSKRRGFRKKLIETGVLVAIVSPLLVLWCFKMSLVLINRFVVQDKFSERVKIIDTSFYRARLGSYTQLTVSDAEQPNYRVDLACSYTEWRDHYPLTGKTVDLQGRKSWLGKSYVVEIESL